MSWTENKWLKPAWMGGNNDFVTKYQDKFSQIGEKFAPKVEGKKSEYGVKPFEGSTEDFKQAIIEVGEAIDAYGDKNLIKVLDKKAKAKKIIIYIKECAIEEDYCGELDPFTVTTRDEYFDDKVIPTIWVIYWNAKGYLEYQENYKVKYLPPFVTMFHEIQHALFALEDFDKFIYTKRSTIYEEDENAPYKDKEELRVIVEKEWDFVRKANRILKKELKFKESDPDPMPIRKRWGGGFVSFNTKEAYIQQLKKNLSIS